MELAESRPTTLPLRVHGGGATAALGDAASDHSGLETHVADALPRARLSDEERLAREVIRRRECELERRQRIFDAKRRTIGVDKDVLDAQVAEKQRMKEMAQEEKRQHDEYVLAVSRELEVMEKEKQGALREWHKHCNDFSLNNLHFESRREFDLNDPKAVRKGTPSRLCDDDPRCGVSGLQQFSGEDLCSQERKRQQQLAQVNFIEQQKFEKAMLNRQERDAEEQYARETRELIELRNELEDDEGGYLKSWKKSVQRAHLEHAEDNAQRSQQDKLNRAFTDANELQHHATDFFLNECGPRYVAEGRVRVDGFKGSTRAEREMAKAMQTGQVSANEERRRKEKDDARQQDQLAEQTRQAVVDMEKDALRKRREMMQQIARENQCLQLEQKQNKMKLDQCNRNEIQASFFQQFGTSTR